MHNARILAFPQPSAVMPLSRRSDEQLMALLAKDSQEALAEVIARHMPPLLGFLTKLGGSESQAAEVAHETFIALWAQRRRYESRGKLRVWLLKIAHNALRNQRRSLRRFLRARGTAAVEVSLLVEPRGETPLDRLISREQAEGLRRTLGRLPRKMREALLLRFEQELSYDQIGAIVGCPAATARTRVFHGLRRLRATMPKETR